MRFLSRALAPASLLVSGLLGLPGLAMAHAGHAHAPLAWTFDPLMVSLLVLSTAGYALGLVRIRQARRSAILKPWRIVAFCGGMMMVVLALLSPLDQLAASSFSAHMSQHLLLMLGAPPLLVASHPMIAWLWCFTPARRKRLSHWWASRGTVRRAIGVLLHPATVWTGATVALWFWHMPRPYAWALANENVHAFEHACFFFTSLAFWYVLLEPRGRALMGYGGAILFGLTFGIQNGFLGAILTFAKHPLYAAYQGTSATGMYGLGALEDQQLAGVLMWVPTGIVHLGLLLSLLVNWLNNAGRSPDGAQYTSLALNSK
jgi:cytochrome c oxidase assembly factor CtaG